MVQPTPKHIPRSKKEEIVDSLVERMEEYPVVGVLDMHNLPSKQLQQIKKDMKEFADIEMQRKTLLKIAIENADVEGIEQLEENDATQPALIFSKKDPFQLYSLIQNNKTSAAAQGGEEAPNDIEVPEGDTGIGPGPMLGKLQGAGLQVQVDDGSIHVQQAGVLVEKGDTISNDDAEILNQVGIEPLEIGLDLDIAFSDGEIFTAEDLDIDVDQYRSDIEAAAGAGFRLAVNAGVVNETTASAIVSQAVQKAKNLSTSEGLPEEETIEESIAYAKSNAEGVDSQVDLEDVEIEEDSDDDGDEEEPEAEEEQEEESETEEDSDEEPEEAEDSEDGEDESEDEEEETDSEDEQEESEDEEPEEEDESEADSEEQDSSGDVDYDEIVDNTIGDAKDEIGELDDPDWDALIEAEEGNKDRTTFLDWLEDQK